MSEEKKICIKCDEPGEFYLRRAGQPMQPCKKCRSKSDAARYANNREKLLQAVNERRRNTPDAHRLRDRARWPKRRQRENARKKAKRESMAPEQLQAFRAKERERNNLANASLTRSQRARRRETIVRRRARALGVVVLGVDRLAIIARDNSTCYLWCKRKLSDSELELDHVIPFSREGPHSPENVRVACKSCNKRKAKRLLSEIPDLIPTPLPG